MNYYNSICKKAKNDILKDISYNKLNSAIKKMNAVIHIEELDVSYKDEILENACIEISKLLFPKKENYIPIKGNYVFCDSMMWDNHGLTQQYLKAIIALNKEILYIKTSTIKHKNSDILALLNSYKKANIIYIPKDNFIEQSRFIYNSIINYKPEKIFIHSFSITESIALIGISSSERYRINLGNHLTWIGLSCTDYMLEFDDFGYNVSVLKRNFPKEKIFKHPMYPIVDSNPFSGFPESISHNKVIMYSGGALYKIKDEYNTFLNIVKNLLINNDNLIFLFSARDDDSYIKRFIYENSLQNCFFLLGYRSDINEVFKHIDIFLQTYPISGGLMEKYAILNSKPVLTFCTKEKYTLYSKVDDNEVNFGTYKKAYTNYNDFLLEANKLINDCNYREIIGQSLNLLSINETSFNKIFMDIIYGNVKPHRIFNSLEIDYIELEKEYIESRIILEKSYIKHLLYSFGLKSFYLFPSLFYKKIFLIIDILFNYLKKNI